MKIKKNNKKSIKPFIVASVAVFLLVCGYTGFALKTNLWPFMGTSTSPKTEPVNDDKNNTTSTKVSDDTNTSGATTPDQVPTNASLSASITQLIQDSDNNILFSATISNLDTPTTKGTCVVTFTNENDRPYVQQISSTIKGNETICGQLKIPSLNFSYLGSWKVNLRFYLDNQQTTTDGTIDIH